MVLFGGAADNGDFEHGDFTHWTGTENGAGDTVSVVDTTVHHDTYSFQAYVDGNNQGEYARVRKEGLGNNKDFYVRAYFYFANNLPTAANKDLGIIQIYDESTFTMRDGLDIHGDGANPVLSSPDSDGTTPLSTGQWYCIEFAVHYAAAAAGWRKTWLNGVLEINDVGLTNDFNAGRAYLGICGTDWTSNGPTKTVFVDCVIIDTAYIGPEAAAVTVKMGGNSALMQALVSGRLFSRFDSAKRWSNRFPRFAPRMLI